MWWFLNHHIIILFIKITFMSKKIYFVFFFFFFYLIYAKCQKYDNNWVLGIDTLVKKERKPYWKNVISFGENTLDVNKITSIESIMSSYNLSASDSLGNLIFYFNGLKVFNRENLVMTNGDSIGYFMDTRYWRQRNRYCGCIFGHLENPIGILPTSVKFIPLPGHKHQFLVFAPLVWNTKGFSSYDVLSYIRIDMDLSEGLGTVIEKNQLVLDSHIDGFGLVQHSNGIDWWLVAPVFMKNIFYKYLITRDGILGPQKQIIYPEITSSPSSGDTPIFVKVTSTQYGNFSPDGKLFIRNELHNGIFIYDFDRCTGELTFKRKIKNVLSPLELEFSPNSKYIYFTSGKNLYQVDLESSNNENNSIFITTLPSYSAIELGPDGKIYFTYYKPGGSKYMGYINRPNLPRLSCDFKPFGIELPYESNIALPQFPNYRLGIETNYNCNERDSIFIPYGEAINYKVENKDYIRVDRYKLITDESWKDLFK